ncbi:MAG: thioredoxin family protein [Acidobacteria bacterium]|nr:thioredoxin family protein [Acidobacteriota bacterium]
MQEGYREQGTGYRYIARMKARVWLLSILLICGAAGAQSSHQPDPISARLLAMYPANADARKEIASAVQDAAKQHKRVLVMFGATWCFDCFALDYRFHQANIQPLLEKNYVLVHVDIGQHDKNLELAKKYGTDVDGVPALAVLDSSGKLLYGQKSHPFSAARRIDPQLIVKFLETWKPAS